MKVALEPAGRLEPERILNSVHLVLSGRRKAGRRPEYGDGHAAERIVAVLVGQSDLGGRLSKKAVAQTLCGR